MGWKSIYLAECDRCGNKGKEEFFPKDVLHNKNSDDFVILGITSATAGNKAKGKVVSLFFCKKCSEVMSVKDLAVFITESK